MSSANAGARKGRDSRALQRATIGIGVVSLGLAGALTYAAASATAAKGSAAPAGNLSQPVAASPTPTSTGEHDDEHYSPRPPATGLQNPQPGATPVAVTGGS
jgi:hypothetical protein